MDGPIEEHDEENTLAGLKEWIQTLVAHTIIDNERELDDPDYYYIRSFLYCGSALMVPKFPYRNLPACSIIVESYLKDVKVTT